MALLELSLLSGPVPKLLQVCAILAGVWLLVRTLLAPRKIQVRVGAFVGCAMAAVAVTAIGAHLARNVWGLFPDRLEPQIYLWACTAMFAVGLAVVRLAAMDGQRGAVAAIAAMVVVVAACANQINIFFGAYPTPRDALGLANQVYIRLPDLTDIRSTAPLLTELRSIESGWSPPAGFDSHGRLTSAHIAAQTSGFAARDAEIYLPAAYFVTPRPALPVLVLLSGQPGGPKDWLSAGKLTTTLDRFAAEHRGLAPLVVVADATGSQFGDPLCVDSRRGNADTYLAKDVPAWIRSNLTVDPRRRAWAIAGVSYGGTCALQLAINHPDVYPTFLDISGSAEPSLGDRSHTVAEVFGGDAAAFSRVNPLDLLMTRRFPNSAGTIVVGDADNDTKPDARRVFDATKAAGMISYYTELPGKHSWRVFSPALSAELPWLARRMGLIG